MKIIFAGSPQFAVPPLEKLVQNGKNVVAVITRPDKPVGRKKILTPTPVKIRATELGLPVYDFAKIKNEVSTLKEIGADIMITCAYGQLLTQEVLNCFKGGVWNIHASLLPEFRGASPIQAAIAAGKTHTGVTVMKTELSLDSGGILLAKRLEINGATCGELTERLSILGADAALECVNLLEKGETQLLMQDEGKVTYCKKIEKADCKIDFSRPAQSVVNAIKAYSPAPAAHCNHGGIALNILNAETCSLPCGKVGEVVAADKRGIAVSCGDGCILITALQPAGGKAMSAADFINGRKIKAGDTLD